MRTGSGQSGKADAMRIARGIEPQPDDMPKDYEDLIRVIHDRYDGMSKSYQKIALYLTQNPNDVAVRSVNSIGETSGVHASSFVRFAPQADADARRLKVRTSPNAAVRCGSFSAPILRPECRSPAASPRLH